LGSVCLREACLSPLLDFQFGVTRGKRERDVNESDLVERAAKDRDRAGCPLVAHDDFDSAPVGANTGSPRIGDGYVGDFHMGTNLEMDGAKQGASLERRVVDAVPSEKLHQAP